MQLVCRLISGIVFWNVDGLADKRTNPWSFVGISKDCDNVVQVPEAHNKFKLGEWVVTQNELLGEENLGKLKYYMDDRK